MAVKIKLTKDLKNLLNGTSNKSLVPKVREEFSKKGPVKIKQAIIQDMIRGVSPVKGGGKWKKYSPSYKETIRGKSTFRNFGGKTVKFEGKDKAFFRKSSPTKKISPVNLRHTGGLHKSLKAFTKGGFLSSFRLVVGFGSKLAKIHNQLGAGKSKTIRRLLPTKNGEGFNRKITGVLLDQLKKAADIVVKELNRQ